jgi:hypothetical protein
MRKPLLVIAALLACAVFVSAAPVTDADDEMIYMGVRINDVLCGYSTTDTSRTDEGELAIEDRIFVMLSALGSRFNTEIEMTSHADPITGQVSYNKTYVKQGPNEIELEFTVRGDTAYCTSNMSPQEVKVYLPPGTLVENTFFFPYLVRDFVEGGAETMNYEILDARELKVQPWTFTKTGTETVLLAGRRYETVIIKKRNNKTMLEISMWIDPETGEVLKLELPNNRIICLTDKSVIKQIEVANLDESIASKVDVSIADIKSISYMKVKAKIKPTGLVVTPDGLNVPGQKFTGSVTENLIDGIFEIEHPKYDGTNALPFPPDFSGDESLKEYLEADDIIESDDPVLIEQARKITEGSDDSWEAAVRIAQWVSDEMTARRTYDMRAGECGAHSLLVAGLCRAVGIPARVIWGCMYIPNFGGAFGQHGWNEIYMGDAGWIPIDATATEVDFANSGHIRVGSYSSFSTALNPIEMEVLDYRVGSGEEADTADAATKYDPYIGDYLAPDRTRTFKVFIQHGSLTLDIPQQMALAMSDPDEEGRWVCTLSNNLYLTFVMNDEGKAKEMHIHEIILMNRRSDPESTEGVPEKYIPYLGEYFFAAAQAMFTVRHDGSRLVIDNPLENITVGLQDPSEDGGWLDEYNKNTIYFVKDAEDKITALKVDSKNVFPRK